MFTTQNNLTMKILSLIIVVYFLLLGDFKLSYLNKKYVWEFEYNGLLWVGLDYWSIWKYNSGDTPIKWIHCKKSVI